MLLPKIKKLKKKISHTSQQKIIECTSQQQIKKSRDFKNKNRFFASKKENKQK